MFVMIDNTSSTVVPVSASSTTWSTETNLSSTVFNTIAGCSLSSPGVITLAAGFYYMSVLVEVSTYSSGDVQVQYRLQTGLGTLMATPVSLITRSTFGGNYSTAITGFQTFNASANPTTATLQRNIYADDMLVFFGTSTPATSPRAGYPIRVLLIRIT
jgi:hypothetical protein